MRMSDVAIRFVVTAVLWILMAWIALAVAARVLAWVFVYCVATAAAGLVSGFVHGLVVPVQVLARGSAEVATPERVAAGELIKDAPPGENAAHGWDLAWPVYVPYQARLDRLAVNALTRDRVRTAWGFFASTMPQRMWVPAGSMTRVLSRPLPFILRWCVWSAVALPLIGCFIVGTVTSVMVWQGIMWFGQTVVRLVSATVQLVLRRYESRSRRRAHQSMLCSHCLRSSSSPAYRCSECGTVHYVVQPGPQGLFHRVCDCGATLANTVSRASLSLKVVCPHCGEDMADGAGLRQVVVLPVIGAVAAGKTRFLSMSVVQVDESLAGSGTLSALSPAAEAFLKDARELVRAGRRTIKTPHVTPEALPYRLEEWSGKKEIELDVVDAAGEFFGDWETSSELPYLESAPVYVLLLDPLGLADVHAEFVQTCASDQHEIDIAPADQINAYHAVMDRLRAQGVDLRSRTLLVVVSKADVLRALPCGQDLRGDVSTDAVRQWLARNGMDAALQSFRMDFGVVEYFACDSMHDLPYKDPAAPWQVVSRVADLYHASVLHADPDALTDPVEPPASVSVAS